MYDVESALDELKEMGILPKWELVDGGYRLDPGPKPFRIRKIFYSLHRANGFPKDVSKRLSWVTYNIYLNELDVAKRELEINLEELEDAWDERNDPEEDSEQDPAR